MRFRGYNLVLFGLIGAFLSLVAFLAATLEPNTGDLTRVGGLSERAFGWRGEKPRFASELSGYHQDGRPFEGAEVLVLGDSFSHQAHYGFGWQNWLVAATGLELATFDLHRRGALEILGSREVRAKPPRLILFECSELSAAERLPTYPGDCRVPAPKVWAPLSVAPMAVATEPFRRRTSMGWNIEGRVDLAMHVIKLRVSALLGQSGVRILPMGDLRRFTSRDQSLLVYGYAVPRGDSGSVDLPRSACGLRNLVAFAARELGAPLVPFFAGNKLSIYAPDIPGAPASYQGFLPRLIEASGIPVPRLSEALREAVEAGSLDVYLPDDSHWSDEGHRITAEVLLAFLLDRGLIAPAGGADPLAEGQASADSAP